MQAAAETMAFQSMYDQYFDAVARYCLRRLPREDANDATAEVFLVAWRRADAMPDDENALPWLYGVARNVVRNVERSKRRSRRLAARLGAEPTTAMPSAELQVVRSAEYEAVVSALDRLRPRDREVIKLRAQEGLTVPQISVALDCSEEAAKKRVTRALDRLRKEAGLARPGSTGTVPRATEEGGER